MKIVQKRCYKNNYYNSQLPGGLFSPEDEFKKKQKTIPVSFIKFSFSMAIYTCHAKYQGGFHVGFKLLFSYEKGDPLKKIFFEATKSPPYLAMVDIGS